MDTQLSRDELRLASQAVCHMKATAVLSTNTKMPPTERQSLAAQINDLQALETKLSAMLAETTERVAFGALRAEFSELEQDERFFIASEYAEHGETADAYRKLDDDWAQKEPGGRSWLPPRGANRKLCPDTPVLPC